MGQYWNFFNLTKREVGERNGLAKFGEFFFSKQGFLVRAITIPFSSPELEILLKALSDKPPTVANKGLASLSDDVLYLILEEVEYLEALVALAITCRRLFALTYKGIIQSRNRIASPWVLGRVACIGDYADFEDLPKTLLTDEQRAEIQKKLSDPEKPEDVNTTYGGIYNLGTKDHSVWWRGVFVHAQIESIREWLRHFSKADLARYLTVLSVTFPPRKDWVLCNRTKMQYVRASAIAELAGKPDDPQPFLPNCRVDLGHALLVRASWSSDPSLAIAPMSVELHRGPWVGDEFYITTMDRWEKPAKGEPAWKDVSAEIVKDLVEVYQTDYGESWKKALEGEVKALEGEIVPRGVMYWYGSDGDDEVARIGRITSQSLPRWMSLWR